MDYSRREMLKVSTAAALGLSVNLYSKAFQNPHQLKSSLLAQQNTNTSLLARDEAFWENIRQEFDIYQGFINLENGYYGIMPNCVYNAYLENTKKLNQLNSYYLRTEWLEELDSVSSCLAKVFGVHKEELMITNNGTDAMQRLLVGYNRIMPGDSILCADLDYQDNLDLLNWLREKKNISIVKINIPEPATKQAVIDAYRNAFNRHPRLKLAVLTHVNNKTGLVTPIREIIDLAKLKDIDVIVDAAHSWGQIDFKIPDLHADFATFSLHKWLNAPLGVGCIYIKKNRLQDIDTCFGNKNFPEDDIRSRVTDGTINVAAIMTIPAALDFHLSLGAPLKQERLHYLRNAWVQRVRHLDCIEILTPDEPGMYSAITSFRFKNHPSTADNEQIVRELFDKYKIFVFARSNIYRGSCVRVTPALFTLLSEVEYFASALTEIAASNIFK